ncbi:ATP-binding cassette domain-containing protein [Pseudodesulfovibrio cashew]|uniref:ATP-binding cassette domain-containing protein n=1 Tax=Pseudodesulfovibrio cashew TaxID=2678688 RepID=A0A6I6JC14_9BACT|nr:ABC transporter ATP-binding protein [Pseudodesulfovibrio cashew]QGY38669.1 ATP-binding cassette domain-containing protein [Pseudodesulfovibrio cashew]
MSNTKVPPASGALLEARGLIKDYGSFRAVHGVDFDIPDNCFVTILGPSGCGKTTILRMIGGFESVSGGSLVLRDDPLMGVMPYERPINTVFQNYALFPHLRVADNVAFGLKLRKLPADEVDRRVDRALETVKMQSMASRYPSQLSGGQQQRVALARAFVNEPELLLLDEPLGALDLKMRRHMQVELKDLQQRLAMSFLYVTHDQEEAFALSDLIIVMNNGRIEQQGSPEDIYHRPANAYVADFIGGANLLPGAVTGVDKGRAAITTALGPVEADCSDTVAMGEPASLCIRAEDIQPVDDPGQYSLAFRAAVTHVVFQGSVKLVEVEVSGQKIVARLGHDVPTAVGDPVTLGVPDHRIRIVHGNPPEGGGAL